MVSIGNMRNSSRMKGRLWRLTSARFIEFMVESDVLKFGDFTLKSGRKVAVLHERGAYVTGEQLHRLGLYYAQAINDTTSGSTSTWCSGHFSKGIIAVVTAMALQELYGKEVKYCCNRKGSEECWGRCGQPLGRGLHDGDKSSWWRTSPLRAESIDETYPILKAAADVDVRGLIVSLNRMEVGKARHHAQKEIEAMRLPVASIVSHGRGEGCLHNHEVAGAHRYRRRYRGGRHRRLLLRAVGRQG